MDNITPPFLSVGICTYNRAKYLTEVIDSVLFQTLHPSLFEILIIDNNSTDNTREILNDYIHNHKNYNIRYILEEKQGISYGRTRACTESASDYVIFLDDDETANPDWLGSYYETILRHPESVIIAGKILIKYMSGCTEWTSKYIEDWFGAYDFGENEIEITEDRIKTKQICYPNAGNMAVKVSFIKEIGGFNPEFGRIKDQMLGGEEVIIAKEALKRNKKIYYCPKASINHHILPERANIKFLKYKHLKGGETFYKMNMENIKAWNAFKSAVKRILLISRYLFLFIINFDIKIKTQHILRTYFEIGILFSLIKNMPKKVGLIK